MNGKVYLIGAGPGDYKLLTLKAMECLQKANVIVYDRLASEAYLKLGREACEYINVGKASSHHTMPQDEINEILVKKAKEGKVVARLKGGDPYVFGRGGEEGEYLFDRGIDFEVIPGVTSAIGGLCYAGIPITHRDCASSFHVITGHLKDDAKSDINWKALAQLEGTLVFLMGIGNLQKITTHLLEAGKSKDTPVGLVSWATRYNQSVVTGTLETIYDKAMEEGIKPPTLIVVGNVVKLRDKLNFFEKKLLFGKRILVTRMHSQSSQLIEMIRDLGGEALEFPTIDIQKISPNKKLEEAIKHLSSYTYLVFTSQNAVEIFFEALEAAYIDARALNGLKIAVIGESTKVALKAKGVMADLMPKRAIAEELAGCLEKQLTNQDRVLIPQSLIARDYLEKTLKVICQVDAIPIYTTVIAEDIAHKTTLSKEELINLLKQKAIDYITFTSSSTVKHFIERLGTEHITLLENVQLISIGEMTSKALREAGLTAYKEAHEATLSSLLSVIYEENMK